MSVKRRLTSRGETPEYHYRFMSKGKDYFGVCEGCQTKKAAEEYEKNIKAKAVEIATKKTVRALVEDHRHDLTGGVSIPLREAFDLSLRETSKTAKEKHKKECQSCWRDFCSFIKTRYPGVISLADVERKHLIEYFSLLQSNGRFDKTVVCEFGQATRTYTRQGKLSSKSVNAFYVAIKSVFNRLAVVAGLAGNPFNDIKKLPRNPIPRKAFDNAELMLIAENLDSDAFVKPIFIVAAYSGLREGDICTLKWADVDMDGKTMTCVTRKTNTRIEIPIMAPLEEFLRRQWLISGKNDYVMPEQAQMYLTNATGISYRIKRFLENIGIKTTAQGAGKKVSIKDIHSMRHTFAFVAGQYGIDIEIVRKILGHMDDEMTRHYMRHHTQENAREQLAKMPDILALPVAIPPDVDATDTKTRLLAQIETATPDQLRSALSAIGKS